MINTIIHERNISYDETHERVRNFIEHLKEYENAEEFKGFCHEARDSEDGKVHLNDSEDNQFTLEYTGDDHFILRLRNL